jgi:catechol 2,3-dioxygenase-like lactoylglutathione lyase family enzyme
VRATKLNHVSISAADLEESTRFYEQLFGMERIPTPRFTHTAVQWLRVGNLQLHLFLDDAPPTRRHHIGLTVDDFDAAYRAVKERMTGPWGMQLVELPSGQVQLYFRDPGDNLIELNWPDAGALDRSRYPELARLEDEVPQPPESEGARLYLDETPVANPA